jgi:ornithine decarboxylase
LAAVKREIYKHLTFIGENMLATQQIQTVPITVPSDIEREFNVRSFSSNTSIPEVISKIIQEEEMEDPFFVLDVGALVHQFQQWQKYLPRVEPYYAVKCNPTKVIVQTLSTLGVKFDCASRGEIDLVLSLPNTKPCDVLYANPCKQKAHLRHAEQKGVNLMTFDNATELQKIKENHSKAQCLLRIVTDDSQSICKFSQKFGAHFCDIAALLEQSIQLGLNVVGVSFHVGSGCMSVSAFTYALEMAKKVFDLADGMGIKMTLLDIGGGFPGSDEPGRLTFAEVAKAISEKLETLFPTARVIAEPGRYFAAACATLATAVIAKRKINLDAAEKTEHGQDDYLYYINEGVYGSFNNLFFDHAVVKPNALKPSRNFAQCTIFGPTCDGLDCVLKNALLPELEVGDWLYFTDMGAYTIAAASNFNGFLNPRIFYVNRYAL